MSELAHRNASLSDLKGIWDLMRETAADVPVPVEGESDQERALTELMACCTTEYSPVVVDGKKNIVGALLAKRDLLDWGLRNVETINVSLAAVAPSYRDQGVFKILFDEITKCNAPVYIGVKAGEGQGLVAQLKASGFTLANTSADSETYKWEPAPAAAKAA